MTAGTGEPENQAAGNRDIRPVPRHQRTATAWDMASLWVGLVTSVPSYYIAGSLVEEGMAWWQGIAVVFAAEAILLLPLLLAAAPGTRYGVPFPVLARAAFGVRGSHVPALLRALVACDWFGIESWIGGQALFSSSPPPSALHPFPVPSTGSSSLSHPLGARLLPSLLSRPVGRNMERNKGYPPTREILGAGPDLPRRSPSRSGLRPGRRLRPHAVPAPAAHLPQFWALFFPSLTANVGTRATMALSISDFSRYARSQADLVLGQLGLPLFMGSFAFVGLAVTSATETIFGGLISSPIKLVSHIGGVVAKILV